MGRTLAESDSRADVEAIAALYRDREKSPNYSRNYNHVGCTAILNGLVRAAKDRPTKETLRITMERIDDLAMEYLSRKNVLRWPSNTKQRKQLARLLRAKTRTDYLDVASKLHQVLWGSIIQHAEGLSECERTALSSLWMGEGSPDSEILAGLAPSVQLAAGQALDAIHGRKGKRGPKMHALEAWYAWRLVPIYEGVTRVKP